MSYPNLVWETDLQSPEIRLAREGDDLILRSAASGDTVNVFSGYFGDGWLVQEIHLSRYEGIILRRPEVEATLANGGVVPHGLDLHGSGTMVGTAYMDFLFATVGGGTLRGMGGNDMLNGTPDLAGGGMVFEGGEGDDLLTGSASGDIFRFNRGDGIDSIAERIGNHNLEAVAEFARHPDDSRFTDRLEFGAGIRPEDVTVSRDGWDLQLTLGPDEGVRVLDWYAHQMQNKVEEIAFQDGTVWRWSEIDSRLGEASAGVTLSGGGTLSGTGYGDTLTATAYGTRLEGGDDSDVLLAAVDGSVFDLAFYGGPGRDMMVGSYARDVYHFDWGDHDDMIQDDARSMGSDIADFFAAHPDTASYQDQVIFGAGIRPSDITLQSVDGDLLMIVSHGQELNSLTVDGWYDGTMFNKIESFLFADGTTWTGADIDRMQGLWSAGVTRSASGTLRGSMYSDVLTATGYGTSLDGGANDDTLSAAVDGGIFNLGFVGGEGNDVLTGSYAGDVYRFGRHDGDDLIHDDVRVMGPDVAAFFAAHPGTESYQDQVVFTDDIAPGDIYAQRVGDDLLVQVAGAWVTLTIAGWYDGTMFSKIESFAFGDGTVLLASDLDRMAGQWSAGIVQAGSGTVAGSQYSDSLTATRYGTRLEGEAGDDQLSAGVDGGIFNVTLVGGRGNDVLAGSYGGDTYRYGLGDGNDLIRDDVRSFGQGVADYFAAHPDAETYQDHLLFGAGITAGNVTRQRVGHDLVFAVDQGGSVRIADWFDGTPFNKIELIGFADGTTWTAAMAEQGLA